MQTADDLAYWLAASHLVSVKLSKLLHWLDTRADYHSLFLASVADLVAARFTSAEIEEIKNINWQGIEAEQKWYEQHNHQVVTLNDPRYPALLKEIANPPLVLYVCGDVELLSGSQLAIVGSRHPSPLGYEKAEQFSKTLAEKGLIITSGLASGIDSACHQGSLAVQGKTIAVMGTGLNQIYPRTHQDLARKIMQQGAIISEFPLNTPPLPWHFPRRNRIISGLSLGVLVVEAAIRSGSLITARYAIEQNREVFAIPGSINHPLARGCHQLIRQGAKLVEAATDIIEELEPMAAFVNKRAVTAKENLSRGCLEGKQNILLGYIDYSVTSFDVIRWRSGLTTSEVSSILLTLELKGYIQAIQGGYIRCA